MAVDSLFPRTNKLLHSSVFGSVCASELQTVHAHMTSPLRADMGNVYRIESIIRRVQHILDSDSPNPGYDMEQHSRTWDPNTRD